MNNGKTIYDSIPKEYIIDNFTIISKLGEGTYGAVYEVVINKKYYALKISTLENEKFIECITLRELINIPLIKNIHNLDSINYIKIGFLIHNKLLCVGIVMELCGKSLWNLLGYINQDETDHVVNSLSILHSHGQYHGDLSSGNLLYDFKNKNYKLCDFGFSRRVYRKLDFFLKPHIYFSPPEETMIREKLVGQKLDLWSIASIKYYSITRNFYDISQYNNIKLLSCSASIKNFLLNALNPNQLDRSPIQYNPVRLNIVLPEFKLDYKYVCKTLNFVLNFKLDDEIIYLSLIRLSKLNVVTSKKCAAMVYLMDHIVSDYGCNVYDFVKYFNMTSIDLSKESIEILTTFDFNLDDHTMWNYIQYYDTKFMEEYKCILFLLLISNYDVGMNTNDIVTTIYKFFEYYHECDDKIMKENIIIQKPTIIGSSLFGFKWIDHVVHMFEHLRKFIEDDNSIMHLFRLYYKKIDKEHIIDWISATKKYM